MKEGAILGNVGNIPVPEGGLPPAGKGDKCGTIAPPPLLESCGLKLGAGPYRVKCVAPLWIGILEDRQRFSQTSLVERLCDLYRDVFGHGPPVDRKGWGEYVRCSDPACTATLSVEEIYCVQRYARLDALEQSGIPPLPPCPCCGGALEVFYAPETLLADMRSQLLGRDSHASFLLSEDESLHGFSYGWMDTLEQAWLDRFNHFYRNTCLTIDGYIEQIEENSLGRIRRNRSFFHWAEGGQRIAARNPEIFFGMSRALFSSVLAMRRGVQCLVSTVSFSNAYALLLGAGGEIVCQAPGHPLVIIAAPAAVFHDEWESSPPSFRKRNSGRIRAALAKCRHPKRSVNDGLPL